MSVLINNNFVRIWGDNRMITKVDRKMQRTRRHIRVRRKISGTAECPRLCVYRSNTNLYVQIIDDVARNT